MTNTNVKIQEGGASSLSAFTNTSVSGEKISAVVPVDEAGNALHNLPPDVSRRHIVVAEVVPTILTSGATVLSLRNPTTSKLYVSRIEIVSLFHGTAAASKAAFRFKRFWNCTGVTGTLTTVTPSKRDSTNAASQVECRIAPAGITLTGATVEPDGFCQFMHPNQLGVVIEKDWEFSKFPIVIRQNEGICLQLQGAILANTAICASIQYGEIQ
jgi:hypothetical protein